MDNSSLFSFIFPFYVKVMCYFQACAICSLTPIYYNFLLLDKSNNIFCIVFSWQKCSVHVTHISGFMMMAGMRKKVKIILRAKYGRRYMWLYMVALLISVIGCVVSFHASGRSSEI